jgi:two-component system phosphate regulon response regulator PhoB
MGEEREKPLVLVADDEEDVLNLVALQLERNQFAVIRAANGDEALRLAKEERPDAAVLDVMMPGLNGYEVVSEMRKGEETKGIPVLLLTARAGGVDIMHGYEVGADDYLKKPFTPHDLLEHVNALLERD